MKNFLSFLVVTGLGAASLIAEAVTPATAPTPATDGNIYSAMYDTCLHNSASFMVIGLLCVVAWICDTLDFIQQKYVPVYTVLIGASIYWMFAFESSVPANFPHPSAVFICNGVFCGFIAAIFHRQIIARLITKIQTMFGIEPQPKPTPPMQGIGNP